MSRITIRNVVAYFAALIATAVLCMVMLASCGPYKHIKQDKIPVIRTSAPTDAFALVSVTTILEPGRCAPLTKDCASIIGKLPPIKTARTGSGLLLWNGKNSYMVTAAHVCRDNEKAPSHFEHEEKKIRFTIKERVEIKVVGVNGIVSEAKIASINEDLDLCALTVDNFSGVPVELAPRRPKIGDKVHAIAAPYGLGGEALSLIFSGHYSGIRRGMHYFTIPTRPGSSGSIVLNENWQAVGSLHTAYIPLENVGLGAGWQDLGLFLDSID